MDIPAGILDILNSSYAMRNIPAYSLIIFSVRDVIVTSCQTGKLNNMH